MLPNEEFALACRAYYEEQGLIVDKTNGEFAHCPLPRDMGEAGYYLLWEHHQQQGLLQSRDVGRRCFWTPQTKRWLDGLDYFPDNYFELWDIYEEFSSNMWQTLTPEAREKIVETKRKNGTLKNAGTRTPEANRKRVETARRNGTLCKHLHTPEVIEKRMETRRRNGTLTKGLCNISESRMMSIKNHQKPVEVTFPTGKIAVFPSAKFAAKYLGVHPACVSMWVRGVQNPRKDYSNHSFRYV